MDFLEKMIGFSSFWGRANRGIAEIGLKVSLGMESQMYGFPCAIDRIQMSLGVTHNTNSQKTEQLPLGSRTARIHKTDLK